MIKSGVLGNAIKLYLKPSPIYTSIFRNQRLQKKQTISSDPNIRPRQYYEELLNLEYIDEDGCYNLDPRHLSNMLDLIRDEEDLDTCIEAFYNFKGHRTMFSNKIIDKLIETSVSMTMPQKVFDIFNFHNYLMYYPARTTTSSVQNCLIKQNETTALTEFLEIVQKRKLIKVDDSFVNQLEATEIEWSSNGKDVSAYRSRVSSKI